MRKFILLFFLVLINELGEAQNLPQFSHYLFNKLAYNPAYAGSKEAMSTTAIYRNQWEAIDGAPKSMHFQIHAPFFNNRCGIGLSVTSDKIGVQDLTSIDAAYTYRIAVADRASLSFGLSGRVEFNRVGWNKLSVTDAIDAVLPDYQTNEFAPNFGGGIYYASQQFYAGISVPNILKTALYKEEGGELFTIESDKTFYLMTGGYLTLTDKFKISPTAMVSLSPNAPVKLDIGTFFIFLDAFWIGGNYRLKDSFDAMLQYQFNKQLRAGVALDFTTSELNSYTSGSYELMVEYLMSYNGNKISNIRFF